jgi:hypothetical protein
MTLTGPFEGETKLLNRHQFVDGVAYFTGNDEHCDNVTRYFTRSYQVAVETVDPEKVRAENEDVEIRGEEVEVTDENEAVRNDDSAVLGDEEPGDEEPGDPPQPNMRQADIIAAVNCIDQEKWVDKKAATPRPRVKDVADIMEDPTVTKKEIVEVIKTWLS